MNYVQTYYASKVFRVLPMQTILLKKSNMIQEILVMVTHGLALVLTL